MSIVVTKDGVEIFYKDWGKGQPIVFSHGWPLSADDWDAQMMFFLNHGYRVIAHDRRGHGRSSQPPTATTWITMRTTSQPSRRISISRMPSTSAIRPAAAKLCVIWHGMAKAGVVRAAIISAVPPLMVKTPANPNGLPKKVFDDFQTALAANRSQFYRDVASGPFYNYNKTGKACGGDHPELVAARHDGRRQGALRRHRGLLADGFHRRSEEDNRPSAGHA